MSARKKSSVMLFPLLVVLALAFYIRTMTLPLSLKGGDLKIAALIFSDLPSALQTDEEFRKFGCEHFLCVGNIVKRVIASEYKIHSGRDVKVSLVFAAPVERRLIQIAQPQSQFEGILMMYDFWSEFRSRKLSFFKSDLRLLINIVSKRSEDYSERSLGSAAGRVGFVEWEVTKRPNQFMWNVTKVLHELGHVFGAPDQYLPNGGVKFPGGYVDLTKPRDAPQKYVEIMSGRRPNAIGIKGEAANPDELKFSAESARAMGWRR